MFLDGSRLFKERVGIVCQAFATFSIYRLQFITFRNDKFSSKDFSLE